jgi:arabinose-5-phosphate isomerase
MEKTMSTLNKNSIVVRDVMIDIDRFPVVRETVILKMALEEMVQTSIGIVCVVNQERKLLGIITDGDLRRMLLKVQKPFSALLVDDVIVHAIRSPQTISPSITLAHAVQIMRDKQVWDLPVIDDDGVLLGLLHLHPAIEALLGLRQ